ncbi:hypothetical protein [Puniceibacterium sp. IMCC21224]|uniref:hypothetical protein n=1 Tax=Puniceibacterium sp. IMCC21224 TaxID=1618204 RepID=UPI00064DF095|nr:hypothetical protein [Puniceibacterium sp. IMCC21224]KMK66102.1 hypothetical protein IMCC21224_11949 [Puniceibacterium sp. IMCC21224]
MKHILLAGVFIASIGTASQAALVADVSGVVGLGYTAISFRESSTAVGDGYFQYGSDMSIGDAWQNLGDFTGINDFEILSPIYGNAEINIGAGGSAVTRGIDMFYVNHDLTFGDAFGVGVVGPDNFTFATGDLVSWSGELVFATDISDMVNFTGSRSYFGSAYGGGGTQLDLELIFNAKLASVPLPASLPLALAGLLAMVGLGWSRARRRKT